MTDFYSEYNRIMGESDELDETKNDESFIKDRDKYYQKLEDDEFESIINAPAPEGTNLPEPTPSQPKQEVKEEEEDLGFFGKIGRIANRPVSVVRSGAAGLMAARRGASNAALIWEPIEEKIQKASDYNKDEASVNPSYLPESVRKNYEQIFGSSDKEAVGIKTGEYINKGMSQDQAYNQAIIDQAKEFDAYKIKEVEEEETSIPRKIEEWIRPEYQESTGIIEDVSGAGGSIGWNILLAKTFAPLIAAYQFGEKYSRNEQIVDEVHKDKNIIERKKIAANAAALETMVVVPTEYLSNAKTMAAFFKKNGKGSALKLAKLAGIPVTEGLTEAIQSYEEAFFLIAISNPNKSTKEHFQYFMDNIGKISKQAGYEGLIGAIAGGGFSAVAHRKEIRDTLEMFVMPEQRAINQKLEGDKYKLAEKLVNQEEITPKEQSFIDDVANNIKELKNALRATSPMDIYEKHVLGIKDVEPVTPKQEAPKPKEGAITPEEQDFLDRAKRSYDIENGFLWSTWRSLGKLISPTIEVGPGVEPTRDTFFDAQTAKEYLETFESGGRDADISQKIANDEDLTVEEQSYLEAFQKRAEVNRDPEVRQRYIDVVTGFYKTEDTTKTSYGYTEDTETEVTQEPVTETTTGEETKTETDYDVQQKQRAEYAQRELERIDSIMQRRERRMERMAGQTLKDYESNPESVDPEIRQTIDELKEKVGEEVKLETVIETPDMTEVREQTEELDKTEEPVVDKMSQPAQETKEEQLEKTVSQMEDTVEKLKKAVNKKIQEKEEKRKKDALDAESIKVRDSRVKQLYAIETGMTKQQTDTVVAVWDALAETAVRKGIFKSVGEFYNEVIPEDIKQYEGKLKSVKGKLVFNNQSFHPAETTLLFWDTLFLSKDATLHTLLHETGHMVQAMSAKFDRSIWNEIAAYYKVDPMLPFTEWKTKDRENFANTFANYFKEEQAPTPALKKVFDKIKDWMLNIIKNVNNTLRKNHPYNEYNKDLKSIIDKYFIVDNNTGEIERKDYQPVYSYAVRAAAVVQEQKSLTAQLKALAEMRNNLVKKLSDLKPATPYEKSRQVYYQRLRENIDFITDILHDISTAKRSKSLPDLKAKLLEQLNTLVTKHKRDYDNNLQSKIDNSYDYAKNLEQITALKVILLKYFDVNIQAPEVTAFYSKIKDELGKKKKKDLDDDAAREEAENVLKEGKENIDAVAAIYKRIFGWNLKGEDFKPEEIVDSESNINLNRITAPNQIKEIIDIIANKYAKTMEVQKRGVQPHFITRMLADELNMTEKELMKRRKGETYNAEQSLAARELMVQSATNLLKLGDKAAVELEATGRISEITDTEIRVAAAKHVAIQSQVSGMITEAARTLNALRIPAGDNVSIVAYINEMLKDPSKQNMPTEEFVKRLKQIKKGKNFTRDVNRAARDLYRSTGFDKFLEYWMNSILSGLKTITVNNVSNALTSVYLLGERATGASFTALRKKLGKRWNETELDAEYNPDDVDLSLTEVKQMIYGLTEGITSAFKFINPQLKRLIRMKGISEEFSNLYTSKVLEGRQRTKHIVPKDGDLEYRDGDFQHNFILALGNFIRLPTDSLAISDAFFKKMNEEIEIKSLAYRQAVIEGGPVESIAARMVNIENEIKENINHPLRRKAEEYGKYATFTNDPGALANMLAGATQKHKALKLFIPFIRTPANIATFAWDRTPVLNLLHKSFREDISGKNGSRARDLAYAKMSIGTGVVLTIASMVAKGLITGSPPTDREERELQRRRGVQYYSIKIGDTWISYSRFEPFSMTIGLTTDTVNVIGNLEGEDAVADAQKLATGLVLAVSKNALSKTWLKGVSDFVLAITEPERYGAGFTKNMVAGLVPQSNFINGIAKQADPTLREYANTLEYTKSRIPGLGKDLPPRRNLWGEPIILDGGLGPDIVSPFYTSKETFSPIDEECYRLDLTPGMPGKRLKVGNDFVELTPQQYDEYILIMNNLKVDGKLNLKDYLNKMVTKNKFYINATDEIKRKKIEVVINEVRDIAKETMKRRILEEDER